MKYRAASASTRRRPRGGRRTAPLPGRGHAPRESGRLPLRIHSLHASRRRSRAYARQSSVSSSDFSAQHLRTQQHTRTEHRAQLAQATQRLIAPHISLITHRLALKSYSRPLYLLRSSAISGRACLAVQGIFKGQKQIHRNTAQPASAPVLSHAALPLSCRNGHH